MIIFFFLGAASCFRIPAYGSGTSTLTYSCSVEDADVGDETKVFSPSRENTDAVVWKKKYIIIKKLQKTILSISFLKTAIRTRKFYSCNSYYYHVNC